MDRLKLRIDTQVSNGEIGFGLMSNLGKQPPLLLLKSHRSACTSTRIWAYGPEVLMVMVAWSVVRMPPRFSAVTIRLAESMSIP
jgi:hypothetical protein